MTYTKIILLAIVLLYISAKECGPGYGKCKHDECCSKYGWCGSSSEYCGSGCQPDYGKCSGSSGSKKKKKKEKKEESKEEEKEDSHDSGEYPNISSNPTYSKVKNVNELSGLSLSEDGSFLWGVGDSGDLVKISTSDYSVTKVKYFDDDTEGVTIHRETGDLIISLEPNKVSRVTKSSGFTKMETLFKIADAKNFGNSGLEGIAYYKNNEVWVGSQEGPYLWRVNLNGEIKEKIKLKSLVSGITEVAGLCYDVKRDRLWIIDSNECKIFLLSGDAKKHLKTYKLPHIGNAESLSVDHIHNVIWVGDDSSTSKLYKFEVTNL